MVTCFALAVSCQRSHIRDIFDVAFQPNGIPVDDCMLLILLEFVAAISNADQLTSVHGCHHPITMLT